MPQSFRAGSGLGDKMMLGAVGKRLFRAAAAICKKTTVFGFSHPHPSFMTAL
jgi:hypothetical protein